MVTLTYLDSYKVERTVTYPDFDSFLLAFSGCVTVPDHLPVLSLTYKGHSLPYQGLIGDLYRQMVNLDLSPYQD